MIDFMKRVIDLDWQYNVAFIVIMLIVFTLLMQHWHRKRGNVSNEFKVLAGLFWIADVLYSWRLTVVFFDPPASPLETVSQRCERYVHAGWGKNPLVWHRYAFAKIIQHFTGIGDPGHIKNK